MQKSNTSPQNTRSGACVNVAWTNISKAKKLLSSVRSVRSRSMSLSIKKVECKASLPARLALGFMRGLCYLTSSKKRNSRAGSHNPPPASASNSTKSREPWSPPSTETDTSTATSPEPSAKPNIIHGNIIVPGVIPPPSNLGRWCEKCQDYKVFARLERIGTYADTAQYIPRCITCGSVLFSGNTDSGF